MFTIGDIERQARVIAKDSIEPYRFSSEDVFMYVRDAVRHLNRLNPTTRYVDGVLANIDLVLDGETEIPVEDRYEEALVDYAVFRIYQEDDSDTVNMQLAQNYLQRSEALMQL